MMQRQYRQVYTIEVESSIANIRCDSTLLHVAETKSGHVVCLIGRFLGDRSNPRIGCPSFRESFSKSISHDSSRIKHQHIPDLPTWRLSSRAFCDSLQQQDHPSALASQVPRPLLPSMLRARSHPPQYSMRHTTKSCAVAEKDSKHENQHLRRWWIDRSSKACV